MDEHENPIPRIVDAVAEAEDAAPLALEPPLAEVVDADALETLVGETASDVEVRFTYRGYDVAIDDRGRVQVD
jgi:hypothetical protein